MTFANGLPARQARGFEATFQPSYDAEKFFILAAVDDGYIKMALIRVYILGGAAFGYVQQTRAYADRTTTLDALTTASANNAFVNGFDNDYDIDTLVGIVAAEGLIAVG